MSGFLKRCLQRVSLVLLGVLAAVLVAEIALRIVGFTYPRYFWPDGQLSWRLPPGRAFWHTREGRSYVEINSRGFRDRERSKEKAVGTLRIAVLGDSFSAALEVDKQERFTEVVERELASCATLRDWALEVINFGVTGWGTTQQILLLRQEVWEYEPDVVILAFLTGNDVEDNMLTSGRRLLRPVYVVRGDQLVLDTSFRGDTPLVSAAGAAYWWLFDTSRTLQLLESLNVSKVAADFARDPIAELGNITQWQDRRDAAARGGRVDTLVYRGPESDSERMAWEVTERLLVTMNQEVTARGATFLLVTLSNSPQVFPDPAMREESMRSLGVTDLFYADTRLKKLAEQHGIPLLTLAPALQRYADEHEVYLHGFPPNLGQGHWNQHGHRVAGELIARKLCNDVLPVG